MDLGKTKRPEAGTGEWAQQLNGYGQSVGKDLELDSIYVNNRLE